MPRSDEDDVYHAFIGGAVTGVLAVALLGVLVAAAMLNL